MVLLNNIGQSMEALQLNFIKNDFVDFQMTIKIISVLYWPTYLNRVAIPCFCRGARKMNITLI